MIMTESNPVEMKAMRSDNSKYATRAPSPAPRATRRGQARACWYDSCI